MLLSTAPSSKFIMNSNCYLSVAPMIDVTDRHCRYLMRLLSKHTVLYTEMIAAQAIIHRDPQQLCQYDSSEHPVVLQLGGGVSHELKYAARWGSDLGYDEINLNVGCPSARVQNGRFGACLMAEPEQVAECLEAMASVSAVPVTIKTRIGIDHLDSYDYFQKFIETIAQTSCTRFIIHARKAWLKGLSPKKNREIPPLKYDYVERLKNDFPNLNIVLNGGILSVPQMKHHLKTLDGVMIGRAIYKNLYLLAEMESEFYGTALPDRKKIISDYLQYIETQNTVPVKVMTRHLMGLYRGETDARNWRRQLSMLPNDRPVKFYNYPGGQS